MAEQVARVRYKWEPLVEKIHKGEGNFKRKVRKGSKTDIRAEFGLQLKITQSLETGVQALTTKMGATFSSEFGMEMKAAFSMSMSFEEETELEFKVKDEDQLFVYQSTVTVFMTSGRQLEFSGHLSSFSEPKKSFLEDWTPSLSKEAPADAEPEADHASIPTGDVYITNHRGEYLYAAWRTDWLVGRRYVHTWIPGGSPHLDPQAKWHIFSLGENTWGPTYGIKSCRYAEYLYATQHNDHHNGRRYVHTWTRGGRPEDDVQGQWNIRHRKDSSNFTIASGTEYFYSAEQSDGNGRRYVFTWMRGGEADRDEQAEWVITPV